MPADDAITRRRPRTTGREKREWVRLWLRRNGHRRPGNLGRGPRNRLLAEGYLALFWPTTGKADAQQSLRRYLGR